MTSPSDSKTAAAAAIHSMFKSIQKGDLENFEAAHKELLSTGYDSTIATTRCLAMAAERGEELLYHFISQRYTQYVKGPHPELVKLTKKAERYKKGCQGYQAPGTITLSLPAF